MPIFKAGSKLIYYAHVPKCGGSAVEEYLTDRFGGHGAFQNTQYTSRPEKLRWTKTSPQHIDVEALGLLFPADFFDASFAIVRHPVSRLVSAYHFQLEVEGTVPETTGFSEWLHDLPDRIGENPFAFDNHIRPMAEIVPEGAQIFYLEHGLDAMVPWLDHVTGQKVGMRAVPHTNKQGEYVKGGAAKPKAKPTDADLATIAKMYAEDFRRFAYELTARQPTVAAPEMTPEQLAERDAQRQVSQTPLYRLKAKLRKALS